MAPLHFTRHYTEIDSTHHSYINGNQGSGKLWIIIDARNPNDYVSIQQFLKACSSNPPTILIGNEHEQLKALYDGKANCFSLLYDEHIVQECKKLIREKTQGR